MPVAVRPLSPVLAEKARLELFEDPKKLEDGIAHLKEWISKQPHLRARTNDQWLAAFLRGCKFSLERTKEKIDLYYSMRSLAPELFTIKPSDPKFMEIIKTGVFVNAIEPEKSTNRRIMFMRPGQYDPNKYTMLDVMGVSQYLQQILFMEDDNFMVAGVSYVMDFKGSSMSHFSGMSPVLLKKMMVSGQDAAPVRMKSAHYLNMPAAFDAIFSVIKSFLNEKNKSRLNVYGKNYEEQLFKNLSKDIVPVEYGGTGNTIQELTDHLVTKVEEYKDWFEEDLQYGTDESKRPGKPKTAEDMFGVEGSFRQLDFD